MKKFLYFFLLVSLISCESSKEQDLVTAIESGDKTKIKELLDAGTDPNIDASGAMSDGTTATFEAACTGDMEILDMLIDAGGDVTHEMEFGTMKVRLFNRLAFTIGHKIASCEFNNSKEVIDYIAMIDKIVGLGADIGAPIEMDLDDIDDFDVHIETQYDQRNAIYMVAAHSTFGKNDIDNNCIPYMKMLLQAFMNHKCDIDSKDHWSNTALIYHIQRDNINMVQLLLDLGADVNLAGGDRDESPLWYAKNVDLTNNDPFEIEYTLLTENDNDMTELLISKGGELKSDCSIHYLETVQGY